MFELFLVCTPFASPSVQPGTCGGYFKSIATHGEVRQGATAEGEERFKCMALGSSQSAAFVLPYRVRDGLAVVGLPLQAGRPRETSPDRPTSPFQGCTKPSEMQGNLWVLGNPIKAVAGVLHHGQVPFSANTLFQCDHDQPWMAMTLMAVERCSWFQHLRGERNPGALAGRAFARGSGTSS